MELNAVILAAGKGTRMCSLDINKSKVSFEILGVPLVKYVLTAVEALKCQEIITVVGFGGETTKSLVEPISKIVWQREQLGTGHAVMQAEELLKGKSGSTIILCGDTPLLRSETLLELCTKHAQNLDDLTVLTAIVENPRGYGRIVRQSNGDVLKIVEQADCDETTNAIKEVNVGVYVVNNLLLLKYLNEISTNNAQKELYLTDLIAIFKKHQLKVGASIIQNNEEMLGINNRVQLEEASKVLQHRINCRHMLSGVTFIDKSNTFVGPNVSIGQDTIVYPNTHIYGETSIGTNNVIGPDNYIVSSKIGNGNHVIKSYVISSSIGDSNQVGPFAHLRDHVEISENCRIGNFVEIKKSQLKKGAKAAHLTYIGDTTVGQSTNIGCGTITANYDGKNKFHTEIGDNVFVGSGTTIIAPVNIENDTFIAAGSTINKDVKTGEFAIARARQENKAEYAKKYLKK